MTTEYKIQLGKCKEEITLIDYTKIENRHFEYKNPKSEHDLIILEDMKGLMQKLNLNKLDIEIKLK